MKSIRLLGLCVIALTALLLGGCASPSTSAAMVTAVTAPITKHPESVSVNVSGGSETSAMVISKISDADFTEAIKISITQSGLFAKTAGVSAADYNIDVTIIRLVQPMFGASFTVTLESTWRLTRRSDKKLIWEKSVTTPFTATMGDAFVGVTRLRLANEGAARENIKEAIAQMGAVSLL